MVLALGGVHVRPFGQRRHGPDRQPARQEHFVHRSAVTSEDRDADGQSERHTGLSRRCVHVGGPVETARGFVLHSADYADGTTTLEIDSGICLTATVDIVRAMAQGHRAGAALLALGYASWSAGQLETELQSNAWLHCQPDDELVFGGDLTPKHERAHGEARHRSGASSATPGTRK